MNLTTLKAQAEAAKASPGELELWQMEVSPEDVLRLVEVARAVLSWRAELLTNNSAAPSVHRAQEALLKNLGGIDS